MTPEAKRIRSAINRLALQRVSTCSTDTSRFCLTGDPRLCCFCGIVIRYGAKYRRASTIRAHEPCFKAVAEEYKNK